MPQMPIPETDAEVCEYIVCWPASEKWQGILRGLLSTPTRGRFWDASTGSIIDVQDYFKTIWEANINAAERQVIMACDSQEQFDIFIAKEERIALALESLAANQAIRYTMQDLIDDLDDAFGVGHLLYDLVSAFLGLFPRLKLKVDATPIATSIMETWFRWMPLNTSLAAIAASLAVIASSMVTGSITAVLQAALASLGFLTKVGAGWRDFILGEGTTFWDLINELWALFVSVEDGGEAEGEPDSDPDIRISVRNQIAGSEAQAFAYAWAASQSLLYSTITVDVFNDIVVPAVTPPLSETDGPGPTDGPIYGFDQELIEPSTPANGPDDTACFVAYQIAQQLTFMIRVMSYWMRLVVLGGPQAPALDALAGVIELLDTKFGDQLFLVFPRQALTYITAGLIGLQARAEFIGEWRDLIDWMEANEGTIATWLYCARQNALDSVEAAFLVREDIEALGGNALTVGEAAILSLFFGPWVLAAMWYKPTQAASPPANTFICGACGS
jgi:hypothetical protein